ncbi:MAG: sulfur carrier protein ThiS [Edaphobacter sp.]
MPLTITLNGQSRMFPTLSETANVEELIAALGLKGDRVAVEHDGEIVARSKWAGTELTEGSRLEVVHFVGGGAPAAGDTRLRRSVSQRLP